MQKKKTRKICGQARGIVTAFVSTSEWRDYIELLADFDSRSNVPDLIDRMCAEFAKAIGFTESPPKR